MPSNRTNSLIQNYEPDIVTRYSQPRAPITAPAPQKSIKPMPAPMAAPMAAPVSAPVAAPTGRWEGSGDNSQWIEDKGKLPVNKGSVFGTSETTYSGDNETTRVTSTPDYTAPLPPGYQWYTKYAPGGDAGDAQEGESFAARPEDFEDPFFDFLIHAGMGVLTGGGALGLPGIAGSLGVSGIPAALVNAGAQQLLTTGSIDPARLATAAVTPTITGAINPYIDKAVTTAMPDLGNIIGDNADLLLTKAVQDATKTVVPSLISGGDPTNAILGSLGGSAIGAVAPNLGMNQRQLRSIVNAALSGGNPSSVLGIMSAFAPKIGDKPGSQPFYPADTQTEIPQQVEDIIYPSTSAPAPQRVEVTAPTPSIDAELGFSSYVPQVEVTGKTPARPPSALDLGDYLSSLPQDVLKTLPELTAPTPAPTPAPAPVSAPTKPTTLAPKDNTSNIMGLMNMLAMNQQQPVPSQVLANMPGFNVEREMGGFKREQQPNLAELLAAIGYKR